MVTTDCRGNSTNDQRASQCNGTYLNLLEVLANRKE